MAIIAIVVVVGLILMFIIATNSEPKKDAYGNIISTNSRTGEETIDLDTPDPMISAPEKFIEFIDQTPKKYLWQVEMQLDNMNRLKDVVLKEAIREKVSTEKFDKNKYLKILDKLKEGNYQIEQNIVPENYSFVCSIKVAGTHISHRKKYILFDLDEGSELSMRPEPFNKFDKNAIAFFHHKECIGYVPAVDCLDIREDIRYNHKAIVSDIIYKNDYIDVIVNLYRSDERHDNPEYYLDHGTLVELRGRKIRTELLKPKKDAENINAFYKKKVVVTGEFKNFPDRNVLAEYLYHSGADIDTSITERTDYVIVGENAGWKKLDRIKELNILTFDENQIYKLYLKDKAEIEKFS